MSDLLSTHVYVSTPFPAILSVSFRPGLCFNLFFCFNAAFRFNSAFDSIPVSRRRVFCFDPFASTKNHNLFSACFASLTVPLLVLL